MIVGIDKFREHFAAHDEQYDELAERVFSGDVNVRSYESAVVMKRLKWGTAIPL